MTSRAEGVLAQWLHDLPKIELHVHLEGSMSVATVRHLTERHGVDPTPVWPDGFPETHRTDHWRCRFQAPTPTFDDVLRLLTAIHAAGCEVIKTEHLYDFDGLPGYSLAQGE